jgi:tetratricopeptide (TPR) repeat protein
LGDLTNAESWFLKSLELSPHQYDTYELLAYTYVAQGRPQDALNLIPTVLAIDKTDSRVLEVAGLIAHFAGEGAAAKQYFLQSIEHHPNYKDDFSSVSPIGLGQILLDEGNSVDAEVYLLRAMENNMNEMKKGSKSFDLPFYVSSIYAILGNKNQSLIWLKKAIDLNWVDYAKIVHGPYFAKFKTDPDFMTLTAKVRERADSMKLKAAEY